MRNYDNQIDLFGKEIADEVIIKENNNKYELTLDRYQIARSLSSIYDQDLRKTTEDLNRSINLYLIKMRE
jgi:hypothetical protein